MMSSFESDSMRQQRDSFAEEASSSYSTGGKEKKRISKFNYFAACMRGVSRIAAYLITKEERRRVAHAWESFERQKRGKFFFFGTVYVMSMGFL